jgi:hypothetical protein
VIRVCGASEQRDALSAAGCWCRGLFCGKGGAKRSTEFRRDVRSQVQAKTYAEFLELLVQQDLFDAGAVRAKWEERAVLHSASRRGARKGTATV